MRFKTLFLALAAGFLACLATLAHPSSAAASAAPLVLPPECVTKTRVARIAQGWLPRAWIFIANFEVADTACMLTYDISDPNLLTGYISLPGACQTYGTVQFSGGRATFDGSGYIACSVNIMETVNAISGTIHLTDTAVINGFYMLGQGTLSPTVVISPFNSNLIVGYVPTNTLRQPVGLYAPISETGALTRALIYSEFNAGPKILSHCAMPVSTVDQRFAFTRDNFDTKYWSDGLLRCDLPPFPKIDLAQDGGVFFIGGTPVLGGWFSGRRLLGTLEEVIVDPFDGGEPPAIPDGVMGPRLFLPIVMASN